MKLRWRNLPVPEAHLGTIILGATFQRLFPKRLFRTGQTGRLLGWPLIILGTGLSLWATAAAGEMDISLPDVLLTDGPYRVSRNPMYVGWTLLQAGLAFTSNAFWIMALLPIVNLYMDWTYVRREERLLAHKFGNKYAEYTRRVPRYI
jgi:protein-S-isoprenylcysteine O-methyltransferase Ste14